MALLVDGLYFLALCLALPYLFFRGLVDRHFYETKILPRLRPVPRRKKNKPCIWIHSVSVGEVLAMAHFVQALEREFPQFEVVLSTTTPTGYEIAQKTFPDNLIFFYPLDVRSVVRHTFRRIRPALVLLVELEVWPNFLDVAQQANIPVMVINGRMTERSFQHYEKGLFFFRPVFQKVDYYCVQTPEYARRFQKLGVDPAKIQSSGNLKYDNVFSGNTEALQREMEEKLHLSPTDTVFIGGSTHPGEEEALVEIYRKLRGDYPSLQLILAPRHPRRIPEIVRMIRSKNEGVILRSSLKKKAPSLAKEDKKIILIDTLGELSKIYAVAEVVFVGGSLVPRGGHNMLEPAALGKAIVVGPHTENFKKIVEFLDSHQAIEIAPDQVSLENKIQGLLRDVSRRKALAQRAKKAIEESTGATKTTIEIVKKLILL